jgi:hypothetical protein
MSASCKRFERARSFKVEIWDLTRDMGDDGRSCIGAGAGTGESAKPKPEIWGAAGAGGSTGAGGGALKEDDECTCIPASMDPGGRGFASKVAGDAVSSGASGDPCTRMPDKMPPVERAASPAPPEMTELPPSSSSCTCKPERSPPGPPLGPVLSSFIAAAPILNPVFFFFTTAD